MCVLYNNEIYFSFYIYDRIFQKNPPLVYMEFAASKKYSKWKIIDASFSFIFLSTEGKKMIFMLKIKISMTKTSRLYEARKMIPSWFAEIIFNLSKIVKIKSVKLRGYNS